MREALKQRRTRLILGAVGLVILVVLAAAIGFLVGSGDVDELESQLAEANQQRNSESARADELAHQLLESDRDVRDLEKELSEEGRTAGAAGPELSPPTEGLLDIGEAGPVGTMAITPESFTEITNQGETVEYQAILSVQNNGSEGINPFCGDEGALIDTTGRTFDGHSDIGLNSSNCGDDVQPGLTQSDYRLKFNVPSDAKPSFLKLWGILATKARRACGM